ncbi:NUDIX domain-containing protein [Geminicoccaceae bacterium 1502E]|nr:NUDIX domain-containing protein [Geminicoccaceae bacterium 1502E]
MGISPYLRDLRRHVGSAPLLMPGVAVLVLDEQERLLLVRNADTLEWQTVGGAVDPGESPAEAAVREAREETGLEVRLTRVIGVYGGPSFRLSYPNGDVCEYVSTAFEAVVTGGEARPDAEETSEIGWFRREAMEGLVMAPHTRLLAADAFARDPATRFPDAR